MSDITMEKILDDCKIVLDDVEELVKITAGQAGERVAMLREDLTRKIQAGRAVLSQFEGDLREKAEQAKLSADHCLREQAWSGVAISAGLGLLAGLAMRSHKSATTKREN